jgi:hypothetical protein
MKPNLLECDISMSLKFSETERLPLMVYFDKFWPLFDLPLSINGNRSFPTLYQAAHAMAI